MKHDENCQLHRALICGVGIECEHGYDICPKCDPCTCHVGELVRLRARVVELETLLNTPEVNDFLRGVELEASHQRQRWGASHDAGKDPSDWFWLLGYLGGKALRAALDGNVDKAKHHCVSTAAALANWHLALSGGDNSMRPGIEPPKE